MVVKQKDLSKKQIKKMSKEELFDSMLSKRLLPSRMDFTTRHTIQNDFYRRTIMVKNFPSSIETQHILSEISKIKNTTFSFRVNPMNAGQAKSLIDKQINNRTATLGFSKKRTEQLDAESDEKTINDFYLEIQAGKNKVFLVNIFIEIYAETEEKLQSKQLEIVFLLATKQITCEVLTYQQKEGFNAVNPIGSDCFLRSANNLPSNTLANLYPFSFSSRNDENGLLLGQTEDGGYFFIDLDKRSEEMTTGNYCIIGQSGQGKTWLQKKIISQEIFKGTSVFIVDPDRDYIEMIETLGGTVINAASGRVKMNPFELRRLMVDEEIEKELEAEDPEAYAKTVDAFRHKSIFFQHLSWLREFFSVMFTDVDQKKLNALMIYTQAMYIDFGITEDTDIDTLESTDYPIFTNLYEYVEKCYDDEKVRPKEISKELTQDLLLLLRDVHSGSLGFLFNGHTNFKNDRIVCFDINDLLTGAKNRLDAMIFNIMTFVWNKVAQRNDEILFCVDELSLLLNPDNPAMANYLSDFSRRFRKYLAKLGTAMQEVDKLNVPAIKHITRPIFANSSVKFVFYPDYSNLDAIQDLLKLTDGEIGSISKPCQKHCLVKAGDEKYYIKVGALPYEEELFGTLSGK